MSFSKIPINRERRYSKHAKQKKKSTYSSSRHGGFQLSDPCESQPAICGPPEASQNAGYSWLGWQADSQIHSHQSTSTLAKQQPYQQPHYQEQNYQGQVL